MISIAKFFIELVNSFYSFLRILRHYSKVNDIFKRSQKNDSLIIVGNGPSFRIDCLLKFNLKLNGDVLVVNDFGYSDYFFRIKPKYYVLYDDYYFNSLTLDNKERVNLLYRGIFKKVDWNMNLIIPNIRKDFFLKSNFDFPLFINIIYINCVPFAGFDFIKRKLLIKNLSIFSIRNVIVASIFIGINLRYKNLFLFGVDHDLVRDLSVDKHNNVRLSFKHFYSNSSESIVWYDSAGIKYTMAKALEDIMIMFRAYEELQKYALERRSNIINMNPSSFVDAFPKKDVYTE
jgi:hypothetical protein